MMQIDFFELKKRLLDYWHLIYGDKDLDLLKNFIEQLKIRKEKAKISPNEDLWYKKAIIYNIYVDLFSGTFENLINKLDYLNNLGINTLWLLPILDSPLKDYGFDISNYRKIRPDLFASSKEKHNKVFDKFVFEAHKRGIKIIFDIALNHTSDRHIWFQEARKSEDNPYRDYYIWTKEPEKEFNPQPIFSDFYETNWTKEKNSDYYFFHRFYEYQPDLNYRNPRVLLEMSDILVFWQERGLDGFRADAIPFIWKEKNTECENLPQVHIILRFFRTIMEYMRPNTLLLAEAAMPTELVLPYFGDNGDECNAAYHFSLINQIFKSLAFSDSSFIINSLSDKDFENDYAYQWFLFLRGHDELNFDLETKEDRKFILQSYGHNPLWFFKKGKSIAARLADILNNDNNRILLAFSILLTMPVTPIIFYGDEYAKKTDYDFYEKMKKITGIDDKRYLARGFMNWNKIQNSELYRKLKPLINLRKKFADILGAGKMSIITFKNSDGNPIKKIFAYSRCKEDEKIIIINNLSKDALKITFPRGNVKEIVNSNVFFYAEKCILKPYGFAWFISN